MLRLAVLIALWAGLADRAAADLQGRVVGVPDGDTLTIRVDGESLRVGLDGVDAPELGQPYGKSARRSLVQLCRGKEASVVERGKDEAGRILASVRCGEVDANAEQVHGVGASQVPAARIASVRIRDQRQAARGGTVGREGAGPALGMASAQREEER